MAAARSACEKKTELSFSMPLALKCATRMACNKACNNPVLWGSCSPALQKLGLAPSFPFRAFGLLPISS